ncbi:L-arabinose isomerase [Salsuginibacillus kocurii]|uniref:L-arabinose isomerase n=1 Tax=Salsuginibacillus kocurii TaxID=427078 RepID=UPI00036E6C5B|nr:L-arabinose isomerase [Salsuginibacillus kocurii]
MGKQGAYEFWFVTGSQHLYGSESLQEVEEHSKRMVEGLNEKANLPSPLIFKEVSTNSESIRKLILEANRKEECAGLITWMHTFSPAKMWIAGLSELNKPMLHLHTQFNQDIPWDSIDMDFMNLNQSAHGDREYGFMNTRMNIARKVVVGHWQQDSVQERIKSWMFTASAHQESKFLKVARFSDNMRGVAVTEGDKVEAQIKFGWSVHAFGIGDLVEKINQVEEHRVRNLLEEYEELYHFDMNNKTIYQSTFEQARIEIGLKEFLDEGGFKAFTTNFEDLHGMKQLPGLAVQRLMEQGYGFGGEGDWKTAALVRLMKVMAGNRGTSFMEDYTYHLEPGNELVLGSHMLEVCPTIASTKPEVQVQPLSMGGKEDPSRLVFNSQAGKALNASLVDMGGRFRLVINEVEAVPSEKEMPNLPVARVLWKPQPTFAESAEAWIYAGGAHHTAFSYHVSTEQLIDWAETVGIECVVIDASTEVSAFRKELQWNQAIW